MAVDYEQRLKELRQAMHRKSIGALLLSKPENKRWLSGFHSTNYTLLVMPNEAYLFTDFRYVEAAEKLSPWYLLVETDRENPLEQRVASLSVQELFVEEDFLTVSFYRKLTKALSFEPARGDGIIEALRSVKDDFELNLLKKAQALGDRCFSHMLSTMHLGMTEQQAAKEIERFFLEHGASGLSFDTIVASGNRSSMPHAEPTDKRFEPGDFVTLDFGCVLDGYCSDMTRTVLFGKADSQQKELYELVLMAQKAGCASIRAGMTGAEADHIVRSVIEDAGYEAFFGHGTGHGIGLEVHESPTINPTSADILLPGMVTSIEPGIYLPKKYGVRIEDLAIVTDSGIINITKSNKELIEL